MVVGGGGTTHTLDWRKSLPITEEDVLLCGLSQGLIKLTDACSMHRQKGKVAGCADGWLTDWMIGLMAPWLIVIDCLSGLIL